MMLLVALLLLYHMNFTWGAYVLTTALWAGQLYLAKKGLDDLKKGLHNGGS